MGIKHVKFNKLSLLSMLVLSVALTAAPALAQTTTTTTTRGAANIQKIIQRSDLAITQRVGKLNVLVARINAMQKLSDANKNTLATSLQNEVGELSALETKVDADTDLSTLRTDAQSITKSYRIYALVLPQATIAAASDRVLTIVDLMNGVYTKLQTRISQLQSTASTTSIQTAMSDISAKLSDATTQANAAVAETSSLVPDQGNTTIAASNTAALKDARDKIKTASTDLIAARKDFETIVQAVRDLEKSNASTSTAQ